MEKLSESGYLKDVVYTVKPSYSPVILSEVWGHHSFTLQTTDF